MKVMEVSIEERDRTIEMITPPRKKMKQAQLPFQMISPLGSSGATVNKKRKLESPSPVESRSPRTSTGVKKKNSAKRVKGSAPDVIDICSTEDEEDATDRENTKPSTIVQEEKDSKESGKEVAAIKRDEKVEKPSETDMKKKKDYSMLDMFLKKAQSKEAKDDIQLLAMSDYESGNSKDSDGSSKNKVSSSTTSLNNEAEKTNNSSSPDEDCETDVKSDETGETKRGEKEEEAEEQKPKISDADFTLKTKDSVNSDDNDAKNVDSDSDNGILSSDDDADDEPDKSSNENADKDHTLEESDGSKTPRDEKSKVLKNRKLTPKQIERRLETAKKREEKQRLKQEKEKKREEERKNRQKEKEAEKEQKRKEKEMKEMKKQIESEQKQKEKEAKEEERRKREEEKLEAERKKQKAASNFANFFVAKKPESKAAEEDIVVKRQNFMPFEVKVDMRIAPITRRNLNNENKLTFEGLFNKEVSPSKLYLNELKLNRTIGRSGKTWPYEAKDDVVVIGEDDSSDAVDPGSAPITEKHHPKMFMFAENRRPPFWGTWRKKSDHINPRRPFAKDSKWFDYDVDSDDEWEEEEPGESIRGSDDERDEEGPEENEYDVDNDFMVPHGYLSDEEAKADEEDGEDMSPETQKLKLKLLGEQFEAERKTKTSRIKPKVIGCIWQGSINVYPENTAPNVIDILKCREAWVREIPVVLTASLSISENIPPNITECGSPAAQTMGPKKKSVPEEAMPNLIRLVHGNINGRIFLMKEFMAHWEKNKTGDRQISKLSLSQKIKEIASWIACPDEGPMHLRSCWYVREDVRKEYNCLDLTLPNKWEYTLRPTRRSDVLDVDKTEKVEKEKKRIPLITQFTKKITQEEMQKQLVSKPTTATIKPPKRIALISVPRGEQFQQSLRNNLISKSITSNDSMKEKQSGFNEPNEVIIKPEQETHDVCSIDDEKEMKSYSEAKINDESSPDPENARTVNVSNKDVVDGQCSIGGKDDDNVPVIESESRIGEPMEPEDGVIMLDD